MHGLDIKFPVRKQNQEGVVSDQESRSKEKELYRDLSSQFQVVPADSSPDFAL